MNRIVGGLTVAVALIGWTGSLPVAAADLQAATVGCSDGTSNTQVILALDPLALTSLTNANAAMAATPDTVPSLSCAVTSTDPSVLGSDSNNGNHDWVHGGGTISCGASFKISAHSNPDGTNPEGSFRELESTCSATPNTFYEAKVTCLNVISNTSAEVTGFITEAGGADAAFEGQWALWQIQDNEDSPVLPPDLIRAILVSSATDPGCQNIGLAAPLTTGEIEVHDADG